MASLKKEIRNVLARFEVAQEAFAANSTDLQKLTKKHKKELRAAREEAFEARTEVERLKAELAILRSNMSRNNLPAPQEPAAKPKRKASGSSATTPRRGPGRPRKSNGTATRKPTTRKKATTAAGGAKRGPGRPPSSTPKYISPLQKIAGVGKGVAAKFEEAGVKTPAEFAKLSDEQMSAVLVNCGPRYRNADSTRMQAMRDAAAAVSE